ncbi:holo-ACP synthase [Candidatus Finniella inopinata]|uniref:Holo-[acyl-carrier-protein] synthase n=1 Tax=Candidatus Finniella inopinata TaxID=1696036 RepID=A0A4Q7DKQ8_9PROT|nr:holo-ACP synthase [Candidatus Finniella inopinata]RZI45266.1 holo-[acyl-carrier-protein] synthase [Candidatus Finniella inopinata]
MIVGIGTDLIDCRRLEKAIGRHGQRFLDRVFTPQEQRRCLNRHHVYQSFGKIYAAKEAALKAIGNTKGIDWQHIEIDHFPTGKPRVVLTHQALANYSALIPVDMCGKLDLSLTDEPPYAQAFVVISATFLS